MMYCVTKYMAIQFIVGNCNIKIQKGFKISLHNWLLLMSLM